MNNHNQILSEISPAEYEQLRPKLKLVSLRLGEVLFRPDEQIELAYFPTTAIISLLTSLSDGAGLEVGLVGHEGVAGLAPILGGRETKVATTQFTGDAYTLPASTFREVFDQGGNFQRRTLRYLHALMTQISQSVVCNVRHPVEGRLARWLLMYRDRARTTNFNLTHEFMSNMLGVRRSSVTEVAGKLQEMGLIRYDRGQIELINEPGLEAFACECYGVVKEQFELLDLRQPNGNRPQVG